MAQLRPRPDLDQLRRQARELLRAARDQDPGATARIRAVSETTTLSSAMHALAREHGFPSWPRLKAEAERRIAQTPSFVLRYVRGEGELQELWHRIWRILGHREPRSVPHWGVFDDFEGTRHRMLALEHDGRMIGGVMFLKLIAIEPWARGIGLGTRIWQAAEGEAVLAGHGLSTHADPDNVGFFLKLGYEQHGRSGRHMRKGLPLSERMRELRTRRWRERTGDLSAGVVLQPDPATGKVAPVAW